jgi:Tfp pilus assembly PilM family ATPase
MTRALGIDIGSHSIKIAEIEYTKKARHIVGLYSCALEPGRTPGELLREFLDKGQIRADRVAVGTGAAQVLVKNFEFPFGDRKKAEAAARGEWETEVPFELDDFILELRQVERQGRSWRFISGLCSRSDVEALNATAQDGGLQPNGFFMDAEALAQLALHQQLPAADAGDCYAVVDIGWRRTKIAVLRGSRPEVFDPAIRARGHAEILELRQIERGSEDWVRWISERRKVPTDEALQWLVHRAEIQVGGEPEDSIREDLSDDIKTALRPVIVELYQTFQASRGKHEAMPRTVYLTGGLTHIRGLRDFLEQELRAQVHAWPLFTGFEHGNFPVGETEQRSFATALALAHHFSLPRPSGWLNFRRTTNPKRKVVSEAVAWAAQPQIRVPALGFAGFVGALWAYSIVAGLFISMQSTEVEKNLTGELRRIDSMTAQRAPTFLSDPNRTREIFQGLARSKARKRDLTYEKARSRVTILSDLSAALPAQLQVQDMNVRGGGSAGLQLQVKIRTTKTEDAAQAEQLGQNLIRSLEAKGYKDLSVKAGAGGSLELKAAWKGRDT